MSEGRHSLGTSVAVALGLCLMAAVASLFPESFALDREALLQGELWRLWTGHLVHFTAGHFLLDVGAGMLLLGFLPTKRAALLLPPVVGLGVLLTDSSLPVYAGLSGVLHAWTVLVAIDLCRVGGRLERVFAIALLLGVTAKALLETLTSTAVFTTSVDMGGETIHVAHLLGVAAGLLLSLVTRWCRPVTPPAGPADLGPSHPVLIQGPG